MHKKEILSLKTKTNTKRLTLIPVECYNKGGFVKLKLGLGKGRKEFEKREKLKKRDMEREMQRELRGKDN